jgi:hypothetical protein
VKALSSQPFLVFVAHLLDFALEGKIESGNVDFDRLSHQIDGAGYKLDSTDTFLTRAEIVALFIEAIATTTL